MSKILIIEDDRAIVDVLRMILEHDGYSIEHAYNGPAGIEKFREFNPDVVLLDIKMPIMDGIEVLQELKQIDKKPVIIMISGHGNIETAVQTTKLGAYDFIAKPFDVDRLKLTIQNGLNYLNLLSENESMKRLMSSSKEILIGESEPMNRLRDYMQKVAATSTRVLITGENGTGKELVAKEIHKLSDRFDKPFVHVNCATIPNDMIEVELFGSVEGYLAYSPSKRTGKFELANGGTLFLDEIADLNLNAQSKLLYVLGENRIVPIGSNNYIDIDVRIIASTNRDLNELISEGIFREDLYHRINVITINVPPLRERREDIPLLINYFTEQISKQNNLPLKKFAKSTLDYLCSLKWPGNIRELKNTIERMIILTDSDVIEKKDLEGENHKFLSNFDKVINSSISLHEFQDQSEKIFIEKKLQENNWNVSKTAEALNIQRSHLYTKIKQYQLENPNKEQ
ncbi:MAG: sigma-54-dependent Fis family transcriptional regulator [Ignavibacteriae bacterium]|nr:MAG: sigma-54-dependent Fis family transcriptional regulator [Ignavibacteriota bacterium]